MAAPTSWQNTPGQASVWELNGTSIKAAAGVGPANGPGVNISSVSNSNGDSKADILWQTNNGQAVPWQMNGTNLASAFVLGPANGSAWHALASA